MSMFCGKCDLYDSVFMVGNSKNLSDKEIFEKFKEETGGVIYQFKSIELNKFNIKYETNIVKKHPEFSIGEECIEMFEHKEQIKDKRFKSGFRQKITYTYKWMNKVFNSLAELNKYGYFRKIPIKIDTLLDLVKYFPYLISMQVCIDNKKTIVISNESYIDTMKSNAIRNGYDESKLINIYENNLKKYLINLVKEEY